MVIANGVAVSFTSVTITTLISIVTLLSLLAGIYGTLIQARNTRKSISSNNVAIEESKEKIVSNQAASQAKMEEIHLIVNSRYDDLVKYVKTLSDVLRSADINVPSPFARNGDLMSDSSQVVEKGEHEDT